MDRTDLRADDRGGAGRGGASPGRKTPPASRVGAGHTFTRAGQESLIALLAVLWRKKGWILVPTLMAFAAALAAVMVIPPRYTGEARILLENRESVFYRPDRDNRVSDPQIDSEAVTSQVQVALSRDLALKVIRDLDLIHVPEFDPNAKGLNPLRMVFGALGMGGGASDRTLEERVLEAFYERVQIYAVPKSRVIIVEFRARDPELAAKGANRIAEEYIRLDQAAKAESTRAASDWLDKVIAPLVAKVTDAEGKVEAFRTARGLFLGTNNTTLSTQQLAELNTQMATARTQEADLQARARNIREALRNGRVFETSDVINNELVRRLMEQRAQLQAQRALEQRTLLPAHPRIKELTSQLTDLEGQVRGAAERAAKALENDARIAGTRVQSLQTELDRLKTLAASSNENEVQLKALEREAAALREQLTSYRTRFLDAAARNGENAQQADARIISRASPPIDPSFPRKAPLVAMVTVAAFLISSALVLSVHLFSGEGGAQVPAAMVDGTPDEGRAIAAAPAIGASLPNLGEANRPVADEALAELAQALRALPAKRFGLVVTVHDLGLGRGGDEGAMDSARETLRLARLLAAEGDGLVLFLRIDPREGAARAAGPGLAEHLRGEAGPGAIIAGDGAGGLHVIGPGAGAGLALPGAAMRLLALIETLAAQYGVVVIDAGPVFTQTASLARAADAAVLVGRAGADALDRARQRLAPGGTALFALVETAPLPANDTESMAAA